MSDEIAVVRDAIRTALIDAEDPWAEYTSPGTYADAVVAALGLDDPERVAPAVLSALAEASITDSPREATDGR